MINKVSHDAAGRRSLKPSLGLRPAPPMRAKDGFLRLHPRPVEDVGLGQREPKGALMIAQQPCMADKLTRETHRSKPLVIKVIRETVARQRLDFGRGSAQLIVGQVAKNDA